eukprot:CAMPEP_0180657484 /NCGR_PEP_ID=MMETSP1037_2-20121125/56452_1 /TAXON_ID=632150 /ORGANISM="Azadinium spinosum, Strain 3D9" /LENGTH=38 /DNA_ID= /DNA_START= /DNA_END= /DNA_ORIENTATION=
MNDEELHMSRVSFPTLLLMSRGLRALPPLFSLGALPHL